MSSVRWREVEKLYHAALDVSPPERTAFVFTACGSDESLAREVESLLRRDASAPDAFLNRPVGQTNPDRPAPGMHLGPYEIESRLGSGGMGEVWKARDPRLDRSVAIKVAYAGFSER